MNWLAVVDIGTSIYPTLNGIMLEWEHLWE
jgi:hypothetical protein